jgi:purine nucleosidase
MMTSGFTDMLISPESNYSRLPPITSASRGFIKLGLPDLGRKFRFTSKEGSLTQADSQCTFLVRFFEPFQAIFSRWSGYLMTRSIRVFLCFAMFLFPAVAFTQSEKPKIIIDQDARGPGSTDMNSILMFAQSPQVTVLGVTIVTGDQWVKEETAHTLRALEVAGRTDIPVVPGASTALVNSKEEAELWEKQFGTLGFKGAWTARTYHAADVIPDMPEGTPTTSPLNEFAPDFIIRMVHKYPGEVTIWAGGPLTNIALAIRKDPEVANLAEQLVLMGGGFNIGEAGIQSINGRREFNWWFDPESVRIVMSAPWKKITITPNDVSVKTRLSKELEARVSAGNTALTRYLDTYSRPSYMWDEIAAAAFLDPSIITSEKELYVNIDIDHGAGYGQTIFLDKGTVAPSWWKLATVQFDLDTGKFYDMYVRLMSAPVGSGKVQ